MWMRTHEKFYKDVDLMSIWKAWADIDNWPKWHDDLVSCKLNGAFQAGNTFKLKPKGGPSFTIKLTEINEGRNFTDCTKFFGAKMYDTHTIEEKDGGVVIGNKLVVMGPLKWLWIKLVAKGVADSVPAECDALVAYAKKRG